MGSVREGNRAHELCKAHADPAERDDDGQSACKPAEGSDVRGEEVAHGVSLVFPCAVPSVVPSVLAWVSVDASILPY